VFVLAALALSAWPRTSEAWKPYTHNFSANQAWLDAVDDGSVTIQGRQYALRPELVAALRDWPQFYNAGVIGPDGFPDLTYGQAVIHPFKTGEWLGHVFAKGWEAQTDGSLSAEDKSKILAFTYGYLTHAAGDMWAHTLVNDFSGGVFPSVSEIFTSVPKAAIAMRHLILEGYIGDATPGYDGNPERGPAPLGDVSDDSTPSYAYDAPHNFIYKTLVDPAAATPIPAVRGSYSEARGPLIGFFLELRDDLDDFTGSAPNPLEEAINEFDETVACLDELAEDCDFEDLGDIIDCPAGIIECGFDFAVDSFEAFLAAAAAITEDLAHLVLDAYLNAWIADINDGLRDWSQLGLATTRGLFDPQARRDLQNEECASKGSEGSTLRAECEDGISITDVVFDQSDDFINEHLLSMIGLPDFVGEVREIVGEISEVFEDILAVVAMPLNPLLEAKADLEEFIEDQIQDMIAEVIGIDIEALEEFLKSTSRFVCLDGTTFSLPVLGDVTIPLFETGEHSRLDDILHLPEPHHVEELGLPAECGRFFDDTAFQIALFSAMQNTVTTSKLLLLDGPALNQLLTDLRGRDIATYGPNDNIMVKGLGSPTWLRLIDGDHAWRQDGQPVFGPRAEIVTGGIGTFPLWESCVLRPTFRALYVDWENGSENFPDLGDEESPDPVNDPSPPTSTLARAGAFYDNGIHQFVASDNVFTHTAHDTPAGRSFPDDELELQHRFYLNGTAPAAFITTEQGATFSLAPPDGLYHIEYRSEDHCHTFAESDAMLPEPTQLVSYVLDTTPPVTTCATPPFGLTFDTDDFSAVDYSISDGDLGSGVASSASTLDGFEVLPGIVPTSDGGVLDMYLLYPGTRTVAVTAADNLGNSGSTGCTFEVHATTKSLINNLNRAWTEGKIKNKGVFNSLLATLEAADRAKTRGSVGAELNALDAFADQLLAIRGDGIDAVTADRFIAYALDLIARGG
jgi:hypothetical protein